MSFEEGQNEQAAQPEFLLSAHVKPSNLYKVHDITYKIDSKISSGSEASTYKAEVAVPQTIDFVTLRMSVVTDVEKLERQVKQLKSMKKFLMPFIQKLIDFDIIKIEEAQVLIEVYEYADYNSESAELKNKHFGNNDYKFVKKAILQLCAAVNHLHFWGYVHRDIKPENILFKKVKDSDELELKLCDFGFLRTINPLMTQVGTPHYSAPEVWTKIKDKADSDIGLASYSARVDVWSIGVTCFFMLTGRNPVGTYAGQQQWAKQLREFQFKDLGELCSIIKDQQLNDLCKGFLQYNEKLRPKIGQFVMKNFQQEIKEFGLEQWFK